MTGIFGMSILYTFYIANRASVNLSRRLVQDLLERTTPLARRQLVLATGRSLLSLRPSDVVEPLHAGGGGQVVHNAIMSKRE